MRPTSADRPTKKTDPAWLTYGNAVVGDIFAVYPERDTPHPFVAVRTEVIALLKAGEDADVLIRAARNYRDHCVKEMTPPRFVIGPVRFYRDTLWRRHKAVTVEGRTREEWALSGQDVAEFDRLAGEAV